MSLEPSPSNSWFLFDSDFAEPLSDSDTEVLRRVRVSTPMEQEDRWQVQLFIASHPVYDTGASLEGVSRLQVLAIAFRVLHLWTKEKRWSSTLADQPESKFRNALPWKGRPSKHPLRPPGLEIFDPYEPPPSLPFAEGFVQLPLSPAEQIGPPRVISHRARVAVWEADAKPAQLDIWRGWLLFEGHPVWSPAKHIFGGSRIQPLLLAFRKLDLLMVEVGAQFVATASASEE